MSHLLLTGKKKWKKPQEKQQRRIPSFRTRYTQNSQITIWTRTELSHATFLPSWEEHGLHNNTNAAWRENGVTVLRVPCFSMLILRLQSPRDKIV